MTTHLRVRIFATFIAVAGAATIGVVAQRGAPLSPEQAAQRWETEKELQSIAVVERSGHGVEKELDTVIERIGHAQAMAALFLIGRYVMHAYVVNALNLAPPVPSIFAGEKA